MKCLGSDSQCGGSCGGREFSFHVPPKGFEVRDVVQN